MILEKLGVFGWKERDEEMLLATLLTGDPLLLIGSHGSAKTLVGQKMAQALGKKFLVYDASKAMFEDVLGYPSIEKLKEGQVEYVPSPVTIWDKEMVLIDKINRAAPELQSKWLEIIRSRKIMRFETQVKWVWAAMNPMTYSGVQALDEALIGRFAAFLYPPEALEMSEEDRIKVTTHINGEDAPGISEWLPENPGKTVRKEAILETGKTLKPLLQSGARHFLRLKEDMTSLAEFLTKFADLLLRETDGEINLDGRRLGFIYRNILSMRAMELAKGEILGHEIESFPQSARHALESSVPMGLNDGSINREGALHKMEICFDLLSGYFDQGSEIALFERIYELFTTPDLMRKAKILLKEDLNEFAASKAWNDLIRSREDRTLLAYAALQVEAQRPGTIPKELLESLSQKIEANRITSAQIPSLTGEAMERVDEVEALLDRESDLERLIAYGHAAKLAMKTTIKEQDLAETEKKIQRDISTFHQLLEGGKNHEDLQTVA